MTLIIIISALKVQSHEIGRECSCKRLRCFEKIPIEAKHTIIQKFNLLSSTDEQNSYLCGLISIVPVKQRRPRKQEEDSSLRDVAAYYRLRYVLDNRLVEEEVCRNEFIAIHGITKRRIHYLLSALKETGISPKDQRGKHRNRPNKLADATFQKIYTHISSFKGRGSHYSTKDSKKIYLPEELNVNKMFKMFKELHPSCKVSYETYRTTFVKNFNISFGYPRTDTCSTCDEYLSKKKVLKFEAEKADTGPTAGCSKNEKPNKSRDILLNEIKELTTMHEVHLAKAKSFYNIKRLSKLSSRKSELKESICIDFGKNFPLPKIPTNDVYYKRQLSVYLFNIHVLSNSTSVFYVYPETIGKKGSDDVSSLVNHFLYNHLDPKVRHLEIFCDSCGGQNKNYTFLRFLHNVIHQQKRLDSIKVTFPIRGHSYMENDKNMGNINQKARVETIEELCELISSSRQKPTPFVVEHITEENQHIFHQWTKHLNKFYRKSCSFPIQPIRQFEVLKEHPRLIRYRDCYNGSWISAVVMPKKNNLLKQLDRNNQFIFPESSYTGIIILDFH